MTRPKRAPEAPCVLLVEDSREFASAMRRTLRARGFSVLLATSHTHARALIGREDLIFDAAVLDHCLPDGDSRELVAALANRNPSCCSLVLTAHGDDALVRDYLLRGAFRYASKPISGTQLMVLVSDTVHHSYRWRRAMSQAAGADLPPPAVIPDFEHAAERLRHIADLSPVETAAAYWVLQGLRDAEIALKLGRAERTAKRYVGQVLAKARVKNRASLWAVLSHDSETAGDPDDDDDDDHGRVSAPAVAPQPRSPSRPSTAAGIASTREPSPLRPTSRS
jgi:DNA-binding NarL/FixJ family response regulator